MLSIIKHELLIGLKSLSNLIHLVVFFFISVAIFAISLNIDSGNTKTSIAVIWLCIIFSILLVGNKSFEEDFTDGTFEQLFLNGYSFEIIIFGKIIANWTLGALPLIIFLPISSLILGIDSNLIPKLLAIFLIATLLISFITSFSYSLILSSSKTSFLAIILALPLLIPIIIFANNAVDDFGNSVIFLLALLFFTIPIALFATTAVLKTSIVD
jgi:heme exporter protein B